LKTKNCAAAKIILSSYKEHSLPNSNEHGLESLRLLVLWSLVLFA